MHAAEGRSSRRTGGMSVPPEWLTLVGSDVDLGFTTVEP
jgi:hypothetical protein